MSVDHVTMCNRYKESLSAEQNERIQRTAKELFGEMFNFDPDVMIEIYKEELKGELV